MRAAGAGAAGAAADAAKLLRGAHLSTQDASRERVTPSLFVRFDDTKGHRRAFEHDAYEFDAARDDDTIVVERAFSNTIVVVSCVLVARETTHLRAARNATTTADNDMTISKPFNAAWCERHKGKEWEDTNGEEWKREVKSNTK